MFGKILYFLLLLAILQFTGCTAFQKMAPGASVKETKSFSPTPENTSNSVSDEYLKKLWESKYEITWAELIRNRELWRESKIGNYSFVCEKLDSGGVSNPWRRLPVLIKVVNGEKLSLEKVDKDKDYLLYSRTDGFEEFDTFDKMFDYLRAELEKGRVLNVKYDSRYGFPTEASITYRFGHHGAFGIKNEKFEIVK